MSVIRYTSTKLNLANASKLIPDERGYYKMIIGGLNVHNAHGDFYTGDKEVIELFSNSSIFIRRVESGYLYSELGHPTKLPGQSMNEFIQRCTNIDEKNIVAHFSEIFLDFDAIKETASGSKAIAIVARFTPSGIKAEALERAINNVEANIAFSLRGFTDDVRMPNGRLSRTLRSIVTFDLVTEPGIPTANSFDTQKTIGLESLAEQIVSVNDLERVVETNTTTGLATESSTLLARDLLDKISGKYKLKADLSASISKW